MACAYERMRQKNIAENRRILVELGLLAPNQDSSQLKVKLPLKKRPATRKPTSFKKRKLTADENSSPEVQVRRRSGRLLGKPPAESTVFSEEEEKVVFSDDEKQIAKGTFPRFNKNTFGAIPGIPVGTHFATRHDASRAGLHRPTVAGIHGNAKEGCYSLALSGGYEDDIDLGECFTYTGEGGRNLKGTKTNPKNLRTAPQSKDQVLMRGNLALTRNIELNKPVRVIRGYKLKSQFAPEDGYRYDGLYSVEKYWGATGTAGFLIYKYALKRCEDQEPAPWDIESSKVNGSPKKEEAENSSEKEVPAEDLSTSLNPESLPLENEVHST